MSVEIRRGSTRFVERERERQTQHAFSFGSDYDPERLGFGPMTCHDDHLLGPGRGFEPHHHAEVEIVSWVVAGTLRHTDGDGVVTEVPAGSVAVFSPGAGADHAEQAGADGPCRFVQMWLRPADLDEGTRTGSSYEVRAVEPEAGIPLPIAQPRPDAVLWLIRLGDHQSVELPAAERVHAFVVTGALLRSSLAEPLAAGDAFEMTGEPAHTVTAGVPTDLLVWTFGD